MHSYNINAPLQQSPLQVLATPTPVQVLTIDPTHEAKDKLVAIYRGEDPYKV